MRFQSFTHHDVPRTRQEPQSGPSVTLDPSALDFEFGRPQQPPQQSDEPRESSPDPMDLFNQDSLIADALSTICADKLDTFSLQEAIEYAFDASAPSRLPSEPNQWRDIRGRADEAQWHAAALEEFTALLENGTFEPVQLPSGKKAIACRWVFKLKRKADGSVDRYKARLVAKGFSQRPGLDFGQVFAPTARWAALRSIFALAAIQDLELYSLWTSATRF